MSAYTVSTVYASDRRANEQIDRLLRDEGIRKDANLDYTCAVYDEEMQIIATGSCFGNTLRCLAVSGAHQGEGLMNEIVSHLITYQFSRGNSHLFLYTKCDSAKFFRDLGFYEIVRIEDRIVFMENRRTGFSDYLSLLEREGQSGGAAETAEGAEAPAPRAAALVMNANPFTLGHLSLVEKACAKNDLVHLFMVSEDASLVPFPVRKRLILEGTAHLRNLICHESGPYIVSSATFPSYFQKDETAVIESHAYLDLAVFVKIAEALHIGVRYVGEEPASLVTGIYNRIMEQELPRHGISCVVVPRKEAGGRAISASTVRQLIKEGRIEELSPLVPESTLRYFRNEEAAPVIARIRSEQNVIHY